MKINGVYNFTKRSNSFKSMDRIRSFRNNKCRLVSDIIQGKIEGKRGRGRPRISFNDNLKQWTEHRKMNEVI